MSSLDVIRQALASTIQANVQTELFAYADVNDVEHTPCIIVEPANADFTETMARGTDCWWFNVFVLCSKNDAVVGQSQLDGFVSGAGPDSIRGAVYSTANLGLGDVDAMVMRMAGYGGSFVDAQIPLVGAILKVRVYTDGRA